MSQITIDIMSQTGATCPDSEFLHDAVRRVLEDEGIVNATISLAIVSDSEIHRINREFLGHDFPTDVISFLLNAPLDTTDWLLENRAAAENQRHGIDHHSDPTHLEGELIVSSETADREAAAHGWSPQAELLLYVVHGLLHLCGYDDLTDEARPVMRSRERELLALWGFCPTGLEI